MLLRGGRFRELCTLGAAQPQSTPLLNYTGGVNRRMCKTGLKSWAGASGPGGCWCSASCYRSPEKSESQSSQSRREDTEVLFLGFSVFSRFLRVLCGALFFGDLESGLHLARAFSPRSVAGGVLGLRPRLR